MSSISILSIVAGHELFRDFPMEMVEQIVRQSTIRRLVAGEVLIHPGIANHTLFLLIDGELRVILEKDQTQISIPIEAGECLGEMSS